MADSEAKLPTDTVQSNYKKKLKYMDFVQAAALYFILCFYSIYEYAKENSGPLKPGVQTVEDTVRTIIGPVYEKFHDVPFELLKFVDRKVEESINELDRHVPVLVKHASIKAVMTAQQAPTVARSVVSEVQRTGVVDTAKNITKSVYAKYEPTVKELYSKYEPVAEQYAVSIWRSVNRLPLIPQVAQIALPTAAYWLKRYNQAICYTAERGYAVATYMPLIPTERIAKVFKEYENGPRIWTNGEAYGVGQ